MPTFDQPRAVDRAVELRHFVHIGGFFAFGFQDVTRPNIQRHSENVSGQARSVLRGRKAVYHAESIGSRTEF